MRLILNCEDRKYSLTKDSFCYKLSVIGKVEEIKSKNYGNESEHVVGYYSNLNALSLKLIDLELISDSEFKRIVDLIESATYRLKSTLEGLVVEGTVTIQEPAA